MPSQILELLEKQEFAAASAIIISTPENALPEIAPQDFATLTWYMLEAITDGPSYFQFKQFLPKVPQGVLTNVRIQQHKLILNLYLESLVLPMLEFPEIPYKTLTCRLTALDLLLERGAMKTSYYHTKRVLEAFNKTFASIYSKMQTASLNVKILSSAEQKFILMGFWIRSSFDMINRISILRSEVEKLRRSDKQIHKPTIICGTHTDRGALKYLQTNSELLQNNHAFLIQGGYNLESHKILPIWDAIFENSEHRKNYNDLIKFATLNDPNKTTRFIDPLFDPTPDPLAIAIYFFAIEQTNNVVSITLRSHAMYLEILKTLYQGKKVTTILTALFGESVIRRLREAKIDHTPILPFEDPACFELKQDNETGLYSAPECLFFINTLIKNFDCQLLDLSEKPQVTKKEVTYLFPKEKASACKQLNACKAEDTKLNEDQHKEDNNSIKVTLSGS